jgi:hypothetical protein
LGVLAPVLPQSEVYVTAPPQNEAGVFKFVLPPNGVFRVVNVNCQLSNGFKTVMHYVFAVAVQSPEFFISTLIHGAEKSAWSIRNLLESFQHILKMYAWSLAENQVSIQFKCRLIAVMSKQSLFKKHDFVVCVHRVYDNHEHLCVWHWNFFFKL